MLIFGDDLEPILQGDIHIWGDRPLRVEQCCRILGFVPIVTSSRRHIITDRIAAIHEGPLAIKFL